MFDNTFEIKEKAIVFIITLTTLSILASLAYPGLLEYAIGAATMHLILMAFMKDQKNNDRTKTNTTRTESK